MKNKIKALAMAMICWQNLFPQDNQVPNPSTAKTPSFEFALTQGAAILFVPETYAKVEGSPYLSADWTYARIKLADSRKFDSVLVKLDLYENKVHFKDEMGRERMVAIDVREIEIKDVTSKWNNAFFVTGIGENKREVYQVIADGAKARLLKKMNVIIKETKDFNKPEKSSFELQNILCIYSKDVLYVEKKNCLSAVPAFKDDNKVTAFISTNDIKCNKENDLIKLVNYYNSY
jgi:hypothetical protein